MSSLDDRLLAAHAAEDYPALVRLYEEAADQADEDQACGFYLTHAYVYTLEIGSPNAPALRSRLIEMGREVPLHSGTTSPR